MSEDPEIDSTLKRALEAAPELPPRSLVLYARLWSLELWLRRMIYVELKAAYGAQWTANVSEGSAARSQQADARLTHMPTAERDRLSYATFGDLCQTIDKNWKLFEVFLPPQTLWTAKLEEVRQIRNRVAHFRQGHEDDLRRVEQFLRDLDVGFFKFCSSYNDGIPVLPPSRDPVAQRFAHFEQFPYTEVEPGKWARVGSADPEAIFDMSIGVQRRPSATFLGTAPIAGASGYLYDITFSGRKDYVFDYEKALNLTQKVHESLVHLMLDTFATSLRVTIPAILGEEAVSCIIESFVRCVGYVLRHDGAITNREARIQRILRQWPEYVLAPSNPLTFLGPEMPCKFFDA